MTNLRLDFAESQSVNFDDSVTTSFGDLFGCSTCELFNGHSQGFCNLAIGKNLYAIILTTFDKPFGT
jgi:hypothetical protein